MYNMVQFLSFTPGINRLLGKLLKYLTINHK